MQSWIPYNEVSAGGVTGMVEPFVRYEKADTSGKLMPGPNEARMKRQTMEKVRAMETVKPRLERQYAGGAGQLLGKDMAMTSAVDVPCRCL